jgi:hypothetical protein
MHARVAIVCSSALALLPQLAHADLYKCAAKDGKVTYQSEPCPQSGTEQRLRAPPGAPSAGAPAGAAKDGWDPQQVQSMLEGCKRDAYSGGKKGWELSGDPRPFPEAQARRAVDAHCTCLLRRVTSMKFPEFAANPSGHLLRFSSDAANGGECRFELSAQ